MMHCHDRAARPMGVGRSSAPLLVAAALLVGLLTMVLAPAGAAASERFSRQVVVDKAAQLARAPYAPAANQVPQSLLNIDYDTWREIRFRPEKALWRKEGLPFQLQFFHPGLYYDHLVTINIVSSGKSERLPFDVDSFDYGSNHSLPEQIPSPFGFAGFRIHGPIKTSRYFDEIAVFLGASYFRAVSKATDYGLSARGLAVDTAQPGGEEFPSFTEFWIERPAPGSSHITVHALLDSVSLTGAYTFVIKGGQDTTMDVTATLFLRKPVTKLGLGPLTSMFLFGENTSPRNLDDFRPEVHDSDGLLIHQASGEWFWRPLTNPETLRVDAFQADNPKGFGIIQRDRDFTHYEDLEAHYERRPSLWVEPRGNWGRGHVELVRIPTDKEIHDNIVAFWNPEDALPLNTPQTYVYTLHWGAQGWTHPPLGHVVATRTGGAGKGARRYVLDFNSKALSLLQPPAPVEGVISCGEGATVAEQHVEKNPQTGGWRLSFVIRTVEEPSALERVLPARRAPIDLRAFLKVNDTTLSETWNYSFEP